MPSREELECRKLDCEIEQLSLLNSKFYKEKDKRPSFWDMPSAWEVVKSLGIFLPLLFASLGYCRSLTQDRQAQLEAATDAFLANNLGAGPYLLEVYADEHCRKHGTPSKCHEGVARILVSGVRIRDEEIALARSEGAMQVLKSLEPSDEIIDQFCRRVAEDVRHIQETYIQRASATRDSITNSSDQEVIDKAQAALHRLKPVVCAAIESGLCPQKRLEVLVPGAWRDFRSYMTNSLRSECGK